MQYKTLILLVKIFSLWPLHGTDIHASAHQADVAIEIDQLDCHVGIIGIQDQCRTPTLRGVSLAAAIAGERSYNDSPLTESETSILPRVALE